MSKGKHKRKRARAQKQAQQKAGKIMMLVDSEEINHKQEKSSTDSAQEPKRIKNPSGRWTRLREWAKEGKTFTDWCIAAFTLVLAVAAIYQFIIMDAQLDTMRKDQRPWLKVSLAPFGMQALAPIGGTVQLMNSGKTPARGIVHGDFVVEKVKNGEKPKLDYPAPHVTFTVGMIAPNDPMEPIPVDRRRFAADGSNESDPITQPELDDLKHSKIFFVVYGTVYYSDFFGSSHWTKFCTYVVAPDTSGSVTAQKCTDYADVDKN
jgi:hypothetical protein